MSRTHGRLLGLKRSQVRAIERLHHRRVDPDLVVGFDLAREMCRLAAATGRCLGVLLDRRGRVREVLVGDAHGVALPDLWGDRVAPDRLRGLRLVATTFGDGPIPTRDLQFLPRFRLDLVALVAFDGGGDGGAEPAVVRAATLQPDPEAGGDPWLVDPPVAASALKPDFLARTAALEEELRRRTPRSVRTGDREAAMLLSVHGGSRAAAEERLRELAELARSARLAVVATAAQRRARPDPRTMVGRGILPRIVQDAARAGATVLVVDGPLSPSQARNLEEETGLAVMDRADLILTIFERRARTRDAKVRVELARLRYELPRLVRIDGAFSRIGRAGAGGAGVRGKGERRLELDRRRMRERIHRLEEELEAIARRRREGRKRRVRRGVPVVALVGYANAGKSTLFNALTDAEVLAEDMLFATLDPTARRLLLPSGRQVVLSDTVGFLRELPGELVDAFRATLEELGEADLIVHLVDAADPDFAGKRAAVEKTLEELGLAAVPRLTLFNKADLVDREAFGPVARRLGGGMFTARDPADRARLRAWIDRALPGGGGGGSGVEEEQEHSPAFRGGPPG